MRLGAGSWGTPGPKNGAEGGAALTPAAAGPPCEASRRHRCAPPRSGWGRRDREREESLVRGRRAGSGAEFRSPRAASEGRARRTEAAGARSHAGGARHEELSCSCSALGRVVEAAPQRRRSCRSRCWLLSPVLAVIRRSLHRSLPELALQPADTTRRRRRSALLHRLRSRALGIHIIEPRGAAFRYLFEARDAGGGERPSPVRVALRCSQEPEAQEAGVLFVAAELHSGDR